MEYWIVMKNGKYVTGTDECGFAIMTKNREEAFKFQDFVVAMSWTSYGYAVIKEYV